MVLDEKILFSMRKPVDNLQEQLEQTATWYDEQSRNTLLPADLRQNAEKFSKKITEYNDSLYSITGFAFPHDWQLPIDFHPRKEMSLSSFTSLCRKLFYLRIDIEEHYDDSEEQIKIPQAVTSLTAHGDGRRIDHAVQSYRKELRRQGLLYK